MELVIDPVIIEANKVLTSYKLWWCYRQNTYLVQDFTIFDIFQTNQILKCSVASVHVELLFKCYIIVYMIQHSYGICSVHWEKYVSFFFWHEGAQTSNENYRWSKTQEEKLKESQMNELHKSCMCALQRNILAEEN